MIVDDKLMLYVLYKKRTENEVRRKCATLHYEKELTEEVIEYLKEADYINDKRYIERYIQDVKKLKHMSVNQVLNDLMRRGIDADLAETMLMTQEMDDFELESANYLVQKKMKLGEDPEKVKRFLLNKGYRYSNIAKAIDKMENIIDN